MLRRWEGRFGEGGGKKRLHKERKADVDRKGRQKANNMILNCES